MRRLLDGAYQGSCVVAAVLTVGILVVVLVQVGATVLDSVMVRLTGEPIGFFIPSYTEFTGFFRGASGYLALAFTLRSGNHIRIIFLIRYAGGRRRLAIELGCIAIALAFSAFLTWHSVWLAIESYQFGDASVGMVAIPLWIPQTAMVVGFAILTVAFVDELVHVAKGEEPSYGLGESLAPGAEVLAEDARKLSDAAP